MPQANRQARPGGRQSEIEGRLAPYRVNSLPLRARMTDDIPHVGRRSRLNEGKRTKALDPVVRLNFIFLIAAQSDAPWFTQELYCREEGESVHADPRNPHPLPGHLPR